MRKPLVVSLILALAVALTATAVTVAGDRRDAPVHRRHRPLARDAGDPDRGSGDGRQVRALLRVVYDDGRQSGQRGREDRGSRHRLAIMEDMDDDGSLSVTPQAVAAAYLLAAVCALVPLAIVGSTFAGIVLWRRGLRSHGLAVIALGFACMALGVMVLW